MDQSTKSGSKMNPKSFNFDVLAHCVMSKRAQKNSLFFRIDNDFWFLEIPQFLEKKKKKVLVRWSSITIPDFEHFNASLHARASKRLMMLHGIMEENMINYFQSVMLLVDVVRAIGSKQKPYHQINFSYSAALVISNAFFEL